METQIKNIVFDFGGVLLDIDYRQTYDALQILLGTTFDPNTLSPESHKALHDFEIGNISVETFLWNLQQLAVKEMPGARAKKNPLHRTTVSIL